MPRRPLALLVVAGCLVSPGALASPPRSAVVAPSASTHAIVTLGGPVDAMGVPGPELTARLQHTLRLARQDPHARIYVSGGSVHSAHVEADVMRNWLVARGVDATRIVREPLARNTSENATHIARMLRGGAVTRVSLVTSRFHMNRSAFHLRAALRTERLGSIRIERAPAADGLHGVARARSTLRESGALVRDVGFRARAHSLGLRNRVAAPRTR